MPYIVKSAQNYFREHMTEARMPGDLTFTMYVPVYAMWKVAPKFKTFFELTRGQRNPALIPAQIQSVMKGLIGAGAPVADVFAAYDCAVQELWTRHVSVYEKEKMDLNGDVEV